VPPATVPVAPPDVVVDVDVLVGVDVSADPDWGDPHAEGASAIKANSTSLAPTHESR
jgi:hypothetical protein